MSDEVLLMESTSAGDLVELFHFDRSAQCFGSFLCKKWTVVPSCVLVQALPPFLEWQIKDTRLQPMLPWPEKNDQAPLLTVHEGGLSLPPYAKEWMPPNYLL